MANLAEIAIQNLNLEDIDEYSFDLHYHGKFNSYNANVRMRNKNLIFNLSKLWEDIDSDIQIGLVQELALKILKRKHVKTLNMDLYHIFLKNVHISVPKVKNHPALEDSFKRMNEQYFDGMIEQPNLRWGTHSTAKLGSYEYGSDTITISKILEDDRFLLDYVMYHEMLHKKHKFSSTNGRHLHHSYAFRKDEEQYPNHEIAERELRKLCIKHRKGNWLGF